jgi:hypothetical protein
MLKLKLSGKQSAFDYVCEGTRDLDTRDAGDCIRGRRIRIFIYSSLSAPSPTLITHIDFNELARPRHREWTDMRYLCDLSLQLTRASRLIERMT